EQKNSQACCRKWTMITGSGAALVKTRPGAVLSPPSSSGQGSDSVATGSRTGSQPRSCQRCSVRLCPGGGSATQEAGKATCQRVGPVNTAPCNVGGCSSSWNSP